MSDVLVESSRFILVGFPKPLSLEGIVEFTCGRRRPHPESPLGLVVQYVSEDFIHVTVIDPANRVAFEVVAICGDCVEVYDVR